MHFNSNYVKFKQKFMIFYEHIIFTYTDFFIFFDERSFWFSLELWILNSILFNKSFDIYVKNVNNLRRF